MECQKTTPDQPFCVQSPEVLEQLKKEAADWTGFLVSENVLVRGQTPDYVGIVQTAIAYGCPEDEAERIAYSLAHPSQ